MTHSLGIHHEKAQSINFFSLKDGVGVGWSVLMVKPQKEKYLISRKMHLMKRLVKPQEHVMPCLLLNAKCMKAIIETRPMEMLLKVQ